jgi:hypothetical protein
MIVFLFLVLLQKAEYMQHTLGYVWDLLKLLGVRTRERCRVKR